MFVFVVASCFVFLVSFVFLFLFFLLAALGQLDFFSVRRLLGSRQVVTQCLCQLNELCRVLHHSLLGVSIKDSMDLYAVQVVQLRCNQPKTKTKRKTNRDHKQTQQSKNQKNKQEPHYHSGQDSSMRIPATYVLTIKPCIFFPSRLSPGRNTVFVPLERIVQCLACSLIGVSKES